MKSYSFYLIMICPVSFYTKSGYWWQMQIMQIVLSQIHLRHLFCVPFRKLLDLFVPQFIYM